MGATVEGTIGILTIHAQCPSHISIAHGIRIRHRSRSRIVVYDNNNPLEILWLCGNRRFRNSIENTVKAKNLDRRVGNIGRTMMKVVDDQATTECSFKFHDFVLKVGDQSFTCHLTKMEGCLYLWLGDAKEGAMNDLSFAIESRLSKTPLATKILGPIADETSTNLAKRLSKKLCKPVYISFNVQVNNLSLPAIEKKLREELDSHPELL